MSRKDLEAKEMGLFDAEDVTWEVIESKRRNEFTIKFKTEGTFNLIKMCLAIGMLHEKLKLQLYILDDAEGDH